MWAQVCTSTCRHIYARRCIYTYMYMCMCIYIHLYMYVGVCKLLCANACIPMFGYTWIQVYM